MSVVFVVGQVCFRLGIFKVFGCDFSFLTRHGLFAITYCVIGRRGKSIARVEEASNVSGLLWKRLMFADHFTLSTQGLHTSVECWVSELSW